MKYLQITIAIVFFWSNSYSQKVTIDAFENASPTTFSDNQQKITAKANEDGFKIEIKNTSGIEKIKQKNDAGTFIDVNVSADVVADGKVYDIKKAKVEDGMLLIKLVKGTDERTLTFTFGNKQLKFTTDCNPLKNYDNYFGEEAKYYNKQKIVYVYDFNKDPSKREFYKISKRNWLDRNFLDTKNKDTLKIRVANFNKETLTSKKNLKFKIYNINKFMYDVSIADSVIHFDSEPSALFTRFFLGDSTLLGSLMGTFSNTTNAESSNSVEAKSLTDKISDFLTKYNELRITALDALNPCHEFSCCNNDFDYASFLKSLAVIKSETENVKRKLNEAKNDSTKKECNNQIKLKAKAEYNIKNLKFAISKLDLRIEELYKKNTTLVNNVDKIKDDIKLIESQVFFSKGADSLTKRAQLVRLETELTSNSNELVTCLLDLSKVKKDRDSLDLKCFEFVTSLDSIKSNISEACNKGNTNIEEMIDALEASDYLLAHLPNEDDLKKLIVFINNMVVQNNSYTSDYISLNGNMLDLTIKIASKDSIFKYFLIPEYRNDPPPIQVPIIGKPFVSFSSGSFIAIGKNMQNKTYAWQETVGNNNTVDSSKYTLVESGYTLPPMGFCALGNLEWKLSRSFGLGGSAGVGLSIEKSPKLAYLGGVSLCFGDLRQFTITGGFAGMQVNKLTNNFQTIADNQTIYSSKPNIDYYKEFKVGGFISLTYTPFKVYKTKTVKSKNN